ncbi:MAG: mtnP, partial [Deltaproteobacteria bacterium]|nr:mtnP [Deltaproteobacteria bacterium]
QVVVRTPFGAPSDAVTVGEIEGRTLAFLPRHGRGHRLSPSQINYRANVYAMKKIGADAILSISAVGSMKERIRPGDIVVVDQFYDHTKFRPNTFFSDGVAGHISFADPVCPDLAGAVYAAARKVVKRVHRGGTYLCMEGPAFSTRAESEIHRKWGVDVIGMTNMPEAKLAREAEVCYATLALATDYDCWHAVQEDVSVEAILDVLRRNVENSKRIVMEVARRLPLPGGCRCGEALKYAIITDRKRIPPSAKKRLSLLIGRYL